MEVCAWPLASPSAVSGLPTCIETTLSRLGSLALPCQLSPDSKVVEIASTSPPKVEPIYLLAFACISCCLWPDGIRTSLSPVPFPSTHDRFLLVLAPAKKRGRGAAPDDLPLGGPWMTVACVTALCLPLLQRYATLLSSIPLSPRAQDALPVQAPGHGQMLSPLTLTPWNPLPSTLGSHQCRAQTSLLLLSVLQRIPRGLERDRS